MCGIVGFLAEKPRQLNALRANFMEQALYVDALRGQDSTGMFSVKLDRKAYYIKDAVDARLFLQQGSIKRAVDDMRQDRYLCVGHNRKATLGSRDLSNAHPFVAGNVCMVHNGTLHSYHTLPSHPDGNSDSARVAQALSVAEPGGLAVLEELKGDYAFVWFDGRSHKIYFANNGKRPLSFLRAKDHTFFASEGMMAKFVLSRTMDLGKKESLPRITNFKPFHLYSAGLGEVQFDIQEYEAKTTTRTYPVRGAAGSTNDRPTYGRNQGIRESKQEATGTTTTTRATTLASTTKGTKRATTGVIPVKEVVSELRYPNEGVKAARKRLTRINQLLKAADVDLQVGDTVEIKREKATAYDHQADAKDPQGKVEGFMEWVLDGAEEVIFYATVHNAPMADIYSDFVDTVHGTLAGARFDENGDLHIAVEYGELGSHRYPVADNVDPKKWPAWCNNFFDKQRWFYSNDDFPEHEWFESTCLLTNRELDILLENKQCCMCQAPTLHIPRDDTFFVSEDSVVCKECNESLTDNDQVAVDVYDGKGNKSTQLMSKAQAEYIDAEYTEVSEPSKVTEAVKEACKSANAGAVTHLADIMKQRKAEKEAAQEEVAEKVKRAQELLDKMRKTAKKPHLVAANDGTFRDSNGDIVPLEKPADPPKAVPKETVPKQMTLTFTGRSSSGQHTGTREQRGILTLDGVKPLPEAE